jgi:DNA-binding response OmpR family regulator
VHSLDRGDKPTEEAMSGVEPEAHILVVDDDDQVRQLIGRFLRDNGYRVSGARDGRELWESLASAKIDLVILDLMLPGTSGLDLCRELRASSLIPIIMLTAKGEDTDRIVGLELGADDYMPKPFNPRELLARVRAVLRRAAAGPRRGSDDRRTANHLCRMDAGYAAPGGHIRGWRRHRSQRRGVRPLARPCRTSQQGSLP